MYPWEGMASQMLGMGMGGDVQQAYSPQMYGNSITMAVDPADLGGIGVSSSGETVYWSNATSEEPKAIEPPDEFTQLSNHKFHELLTKFAEVT